MDKKYILLIEDDDNALKKIKSRLKTVKVFNEKFDFTDGCPAFNPSDISPSKKAKISRDEQKQRILDKINEKINEFDLLLIDYKLFGGDEGRNETHISVEIVKEIINKDEFVDKKIMFVSGYGTQISEDKEVIELAEFCERPDFRGEDDRRISDCYGNFEKCKKVGKKSPTICKEAECLAQMIIDFYDKKGK